MAKFLFSSADYLSSVSSCSTSLSSAGSSQALKKAASIYSHQQSRNLAKLAVSAKYACTPALRGRLSGDSEKGIKSDNIKTELGDDEFNTLCKDKGLALVTINYCQRGLEEDGEAVDKEKLKADSGKDLSDGDVQDIKEMKERQVINHDYLVLEVQPSDFKLPKFYILAEKLSVGGKAGKAGIYITHKHAEEAEKILITNKNKLYAIKCGLLAYVPLETILAALKEESPDYSLMEANCWDYATKTAKRLAKKCAEAAGISPDERARLTRESKDLEAHLNERNMYNLAKTAMKWFGSRVS